MKRYAAPACLAVTLALLAAAPARAAFDPPVPPEGPVGARRTAVDRVVPRSFNFSDLPPMAPGGESLPVQGRPEHEWKEAAEEVERLKANPPVLPASSFAKLTFDTTPAGGGAKGGFTPLAPTIGNGFEVSWALRPNASVRA